MPQNFRFIGLISRAFPEAKIIHVKRDSVATCWSNFKQYFRIQGLGICYDLTDVIKYYHLYEELMLFWNKRYSDCIFDLNYEKLTVDQKRETEKLLQYLGLSWQKACMFLQENNRIVRTASKEQVRRKVYTGSSQKWRKFEPF